VVWPNRGGGFGITEIVDVVNLETIEEERYVDGKLKRLLDEIVYKYELQMQHCTRGKKKKKSMENSERNLG
jgi:hypothetical protein